jgi:hypothetical protein
MERGGEPLWSPVGWGWAGRTSPIPKSRKPTACTLKEPEFSPLQGRTLLPQLVHPNITPHPLWSSHPSLVSGDILDTAVAWRNSVDGRTPRK